MRLLMIPDCRNCLLVRQMTVFGETKACDQRSGSGRLRSCRQARKTGITREALYRSLSAEGNPELLTLTKVPHLAGR